jgi:sugar phosphate isomerase/epimerase
MVNLRSAFKFFGSMAALVLVVTMLGTSVYGAEKIALNKYPDLKFGFCTQIFLKPLPPSVANMKKIIDFAEEQGYSWIELRDAGADLTFDECKQIAAYARSKKIEVGYAMGAGLQDSNFWELFGKSVGNASLFDGPRTVRTAFAGEDFLKDEKKKAWTLQEASRVIDIANQAANQAKAFGLTHVVENGRETLKGDGVTSFGTTEIFANVNSNLGLQSDVANFFTSSRTLPKPEDAKAFLERFGKKLRYIHLKTSTKEHKTTPVLTDSELDFDFVFSILTKNKVPYVAIEIDGQATFEQCANNLKQSVEYLKTKF